MAVLGRAPRRALADPPLSGGLPAGFVLETVVGSGLTEPTVIEFLPDGRLLIGQRDGATLVGALGLLVGSAAAS